MTGYTEKEIQEEFAKIDKMTQIEMASLRRFAPAGHKYFDRRLPFSEYFEKRFKELGGMTPEISREIGW